MNSTDISQTVHGTSIQEGFRPEVCATTPSCRDLATHRDQRDQRGQSASRLWTRNRVTGGVGRSSTSKGTVLSHDVHKELTRVAHGVLEGLATGGELRRDGG